MPQARPYVLPILRRPRRVHRRSGFGTAHSPPSVVQEPKLDKLDCKMGAMEGQLSVRSRHSALRTDSCAASWRSVMIKVLLSLIFVLGVLVTLGFNGAAATLGYGAYWFGVLCIILIAVFVALGPFTRQE